ncbi:hypothetical protein [Paracoccus tibetensis]|uniref:Methyl-accepting chemotaxis protein n=1 Tax=Paracoccus tibetensis TaxID=336292 RepID=A0A1G5FH80_9RHOB|nr:hypothetical protein [Paracoccus tibetensis]SCY38491.1 hypothetical protein SAMN05660710_01411 [Paracoccus tibetensis]
MAALARRLDDGSLALHPEAQLSALADALAGWNARSEGAYIAAGEDLAALHAMLRRIEAALARTIDVMTGPEVQQIDERLGTTAGHAATLARNGQAIERQLAEVLAGREDAAAGNEQVERAFKLLDYIALVARTHTGSIAGRGSPMAPFLDQVSALVGGGRRQAAALSERLAELHRSLGAAAGLLRERQHEEARQAPLQEVVAALSRGLAARRGAADEGRAGAHLAFAEAARAVGEVVAVLQFHDIARQRLEHVVAHLGLMSALLSGATAGPDLPADAPTRRAWIAAIARLERAQLLDLAQLYQDRMSMIGGSLDGILSQSRSGAGLVAAMLRDERDRAEDGAIGLVQQAQQLEERFLMRERHRAQICDSLADCVRAAEQFAAMTSSLDEIEFSLRLAGFNAAIHAADRDSGDRTIGYIAHEIRDSAASAQAGGDLIRMGVARTAAAADALQSVLLPVETGSAAAIRGVIGAVVAAVGAAEAECLAQLAGAQGAAADVPARVARAKGLMQGHVEGRTLINALIDALGTFAAAAPSEADLSALATRLAADYTMREERDILARIFPGVIPESHPEAETGAAEDDLADIFF